MYKGGVDVLLCENVSQSVDYAWWLVYVCVCWRGITVYEQCTLPPLSLQHPCDRSLGATTGVSNDPWKR